MENDIDYGWFNKKRVNISKNFEVDFWAIKFGVKPDHIRDAVSATGRNSIKKIKVYLGIQ
ncbi:DUF3606 domain-containing protein [Pedobacter changchengzhani]|uniref:DUF3606 domain-containing protein n=1 Tax=Pedobacter changchengzhani TaxID=2529274 RepID=A0A4R5MMK3_9SPHI|nr:DUF3606 domain-containing protein [Pedobacter changchengzhani]TDG36898.1 DUF3606 domain-containing protein [Pedobacter changchengzhani]